jgi:cardiolipin synthase A/B
VNPARDDQQKVSEKRRNGSPATSLSRTSLQLLDTTVSGGSTNHDNRSFRLNNEANLNIYDAEFAARQMAQFRADLTHSRRISLIEWQQHPWTEHLCKHAASRLGGQL